MLKKEISFGTVQALALLYIAVWTLSPPLEIDLTYRFLALGAAGVWAAIWLLRNNPIKLDGMQMLSFLFLFLVVMVSYGESGDFENVIRQIPYFMLVICFLMNGFYKDKWHELMWLVPVVLILLSVWNFKTFSALLEDPTLARRLVRNDEEIYPYLRQGIGGYSLVYPQVCVFPGALAFVLKAFKNNKVLFAISSVWLVSFILLIFNASYSIALFASVAGAILLFFYRGKSPVAAFIVAFLMLVAIMFSILYIDGFRNFLLEMFDGTAVAHKINDLVATSEGGEAEGSIAARMTRYMSSVRKIFTYPVIGALWRDNGGGHSVFLDTFAKYGLPGIIYFSKALYSVPTYYTRNYNHSFIKQAANASLVVLLIVSLLDSFTYSFYCIIMIILPLFFEYILKWDGVKK